VPKLSKSISHVCEYLLLRLLQFLLTIVPRGIALAFGSFCGMQLYRLGIYRYIIKKNMEHVGLWDHAAMDRITRSLYRNIGRYAVDFLRPAYPLPPHEIYDFDRIDPLLKRGKGTIVILGHLGNWEMLSTIFGKQVGRLHVIAKPMNNAIVDKWLLAKRTASSVTTIYSSQALRKMVEVIRQDGIIAILIDQFLRQHGTPSPFLGKEAKTVRTVAGIVRKTGCSVISTGAIMRPTGVYDIRLYTVAEPDLAGCSEEEAVNALQKSHNDIISQQILAYPDHWFGWFHRRFRGYVDYKQ
jgi:Kdo2-lipid IVA lauroyltransferase/acyltransferase